MCCQKRNSEQVKRGSSARQEDYRAFLSTCVKTYMSWQKELPPPPPPPPPPQPPSKYIYAVRSTLDHCTAACHV